LVASFSTLNHRGKIRPKAGSKLTETTSRRRTIALKNYWMKCLLYCEFRLFLLTPPTQIYGDTGQILTVRGLP